MVSDRADDARDGTTRTGAGAAVAAHGVEVSEDDRGRDTALQVGRELIHSENALEFGRAIAGVVTDRIRILGCAMAATENGRQICSDLARGARARLFASSSNQMFNSYAPPRLFGPTTYTWSRFGGWEGTVYKFRSDGSHRVAQGGRDIPRGSPPSRGGESEPEERFKCPDWRTSDLRHWTGS